MPTNHDDLALLGELRGMHRELRDRVMRERAHNMAEFLATPAAEQEDTIYRIDRITEDILVELVATHLGERRLLLVAEGVGELTMGSATGDAQRLLVDPIDGTRMIMHDKRSAWILSGVAQDRGPATTLADIRLAVMTEIPTTKQWRADQWWAMRGAGATGVGYDLVRGGTEIPLVSRPSAATDLAHGFAQVSRFFPGVKAELAAIEEEVFRRIQRAGSAGRGHIFEDQYICSGGQLQELFTGKDRFIADLRPLFKPHLAGGELAALLCCHPYDLCTELIARESGVCVEKPGGGPLDAPLDTTTDVAWVAYANLAIRDLVAPILQETLAQRGLL